MPYGSSLSETPDPGPDKAICCRSGECQKIQKSNNSESHDAILQLLDREVGGGYFTAAPFEETVDRWEGTPIIFSELPPSEVILNGGERSIHPDFQPFSTAINDAELIRANAAVVGEVRAPRIETSGHKKLMGQLFFTPDKAKAMFEQGLISEDTYRKTDGWLKKALTLVNESKLSHSTGFSCRSDKEGTLTNEIPLTPNHVLTFEEDALNRPKDPASVILNKANIPEAIVPTEDTYTNAGRVISAKNQGKLKAIVDAITAFFSELSPEDTSQNKEVAPEQVTPSEDTVRNLQKVDSMEELKKELDEKTVTLTNKDDEIAVLTKQVEELTAELDGFKRQQKEAAWDGEKKKLKAGLIHKPEDEAAMKELYLSDPYTYMQKAEYITAVSTPESGDKYTNKGEDVPKDDAATIARELRKITGRS